MSTSACSDVEMVLSLSEEKSVMVNQVAMLVKRLMTTLVRLSQMELPSVSLLKRLLLEINLKPRLELRLLLTERQEMLLKKLPMMKYSIQKSLLKKLKLSNNKRLLPMPQLAAVMESKMTERNAMMETSSTRTDVIKTVELNVDSLVSVEDVDQSAETASKLEPRDVTELKDAQTTVLLFQTMNVILRRTSAHMFAEMELRTTEKSVMEVTTS